MGLSAYRRANLLDTTGVHVSIRAADLSHDIRGERNGLWRGIRNAQAVAMDGGDHGHRLDRVGSGDCGDGDRVRAGRACGFVL